MALGQILTVQEQRDAVHVAIFPVEAKEQIYPGQRVGADGCASTKPHVGIVDAFLTSVVYPGQRYYICLFPETVTGMRHHWEHPAFDRPNVDIEWLTKFARNLDLTYDELLAGVVNALNQGDTLIFGHDLPECVYNDRQEFWRHYNNVMGTDVDTDDYLPFSCAC